MATPQRFDILSNSDIAKQRRSALYDKMNPQQTITESIMLTQDSHSVVWVDTTDGDVDVSTPDPAEVLCKDFTVKKVNVGGGVCRVMGAIDDQTNVVLDDFAAVSIKSIGSQWMVTGSHRLNVFG